MTEIEKRPTHEEPFLIDPGSEDPGAGIDQIPPEPAPTVHRPAKDEKAKGADRLARSGESPVRP